MKKIIEIKTFQASKGDYLEMRITHVSDRLLVVRLTDVTVDNTISENGRHIESVMKEVLCKAVRKCVLTADEADVIASAFNVPFNACIV